MSEPHPEPDPRISHAPPRLAYVLTSYGDGEQLLRLVRTLRRGDPRAAVVVQHDETHHPLDRAPLEALGVHVLLSPETIGWGDITLERARWRLFDWVLTNLDVDWVMLLSEQDYPTAPFAVLHARLTAATAAGDNAVIEAWPIAEVPDPAIRAEAEQRYRFQYRALPDIGFERRLPEPLAKVFRWVRGVAIHRLREHRLPVRLYAPAPAVGAPARIGFLALRSPFTADAPCWFDSCWFAIDRRAMQAVVDRTTNDPALVRYFERTMIPVESATATIIGNDPALHLERASLHTIRWSDTTSGRPDVFTLDDVPMLTAAGLPFARKFGPDPAVFVALDEHVLQHAEEAS